MAKKKADIDSGKEKALAALLQAATFTEAAEAVGISRKTLYNYLHCDPAFVKAYRDMKRAQLRETAEKVQAAETKATDFITGLLDDPAAPPQVKLAAAVKLLDLAANYRSIEAQINENTIEDESGWTALSKPSAV